jgi:hypothetical protein
MALVPNNTDIRYVYLHIYFSGASPSFLFLIVILFNFSIYPTMACQVQGICLASFPNSHKKRGRTPLLSQPFKDCLNVSSYYKIPAVWAMRIRNDLDYTGTYLL